MGYEFDEDAVRRIVRAVQWVERQMSGGDPPANTVPLGPMGEIPWQFGKLTAALAPGGSATVRIWTWNGSAWADSGRDITAYAPPLQGGRTIAQNKWVRIQWHHQAGRWYVVNAEC